MLSGTDLRSRAQKLQKEQQARLEQDRRKAEKERILEERAKARRRQEQEELARRKLAASKEAELDRLQHEEEVEHNRGVWYQHQLRVLALDEQVAQERGIRRGVDKVSLPASAQRDLMSQDAPKNGAMFFELRTTDGNSTHVGSLDFSAMEGTVAIPRQVAANLFVDGVVPDDCNVTVTYRRLEKGTFVRLQPTVAHFHQEAGEAMEDILVAALSKRSAISVGDTVVVESAGDTFELTVQQLRPAPQVSVIDTELEADVEPSKETEERLRAEAEEQRQREAAEAALALARQAEEAAEKQRAYELLAQRQAKQAESAAALPSEPAPSASSLTCLFRFPDGTRHMRRFRYEDSVALLYTFAESRGSGGYGPGKYRLATQFPRRILDHTFQGSLRDAHLDGQQETVFLEPVSA